MIVVDTFEQAISACETHSLVVATSGAAFGGVFAYLRARTKFPEFVKRRRGSLVPSILALSAVAGYSLKRYSYGSCIHRYAERFPDQAIKHFSNQQLSN